jgi:hypothetical protein
MPRKEQYEDYLKEFDQLDQFVHGQNLYFDIRTSEWNEAVALRARLNKALRFLNKTYTGTGIDNPYEDVIIQHLQIGSRVRIARRGYTDHMTPQEFHRSLFPVSGPS